MGARILHTRIRGGVRPECDLRDGGCEIAQQVFWIGFASGSLHILHLPSLWLGPDSSDLGLRETRDRGHPIRP